MSERELREFLIRTLARPVELRLNDNLHNMISASSDPATGRLRANVHRMFLGAPSDVLAALAEFLVRPDRANRLTIRRYIAGNAHTLTTAVAARRAQALSPIGKTCDLSLIAARLNDAHFGGALEFSIVWGATPARRPRHLRHITLGLCRGAQRLIRIHPILDDPFVPDYYLDFIVHHEMSHLAVPSLVGSDGRMRHHTAEFYRAEALYPMRREALEWQASHLDRLLRAWCQGRSPAGTDCSPQLRMF